jgi:hypothetical protein
MRNCPNCGKEVGEGLAFCPSCGVALNNQAQPQAQAPAETQAPMGNTNTYSYSSDKPKVQNRSIGTCIILSIVTCGIYGIIWLINMVNDVNTICNDEKSNQSGATVFLLSLVTCGIYGLIWIFQAGSRMKVAGDKYGMNISDNSLLYLLLSLFGFGIVSYALLQSDVNKYSM